MTCNIDGMLCFDSIAALLDGADVLVPSLKYNHISSRAQLLHSGKVKARDLDELRECVQTRCPDYLPDFDAFFVGNTGHYMNLLLMCQSTTMTTAQGCSIFSSRYRRVCGRFWRRTNLRRISQKDY